jgi:hypothetical protein
VTPDDLAAALDADVPEAVRAAYRAPAAPAGPMRLLTVEEAIARNAEARRWVPAVAALRAFWTDGGSTLAAVAVAGPVAGTVALLDAARPSFAPRFRSVARFLDAMRALDEHDDPQDAATDFPAGPTDAVDAAHDLALVAALERWPAEGAAARGHRVACLIAVIPPSEAQRLVAHTSDPDDTLAAAACSRLGRLGHAPAVPRLIDVAFGDRGVPAAAAVGALMTIGPAAGGPMLSRLAAAPVRDARAAASILHAAGIPVREANGRWEYRDSGLWKVIG